jgi:CheY-like chemotaxis protein/anti-sigma regulatory factor (Ser/Thr protein kinase)
MILIDDIVEGFSPQAQAKNIELQLHFNHSLSDVYMGDPSRITQIFDNLISNAINFTESGSVTVLVSKLAQLKSSDQIQVEVIDTGIGISEENIQRVFEEFNRVSTTKKQYEGTGLGLSITKKIVELLQGTIKLSSIPGKGSHFTMVLPLERGDQILDIAYRMSNVRNNGVLADISGTKIWLIDDDQILLEMTSIILKTAGGEVYSFSDPQKAISSFSKGCADLLITDIQMPEMNGVEVLNQIQEKNGGQIPAIAISGKKPVENEFDGFTAFVQKPYQAYTLIDIIAGQLPRMISSQYSTNSASRVAKGYKLDQLLAFVEGDHESLKQILVSFIHSSNQNLKLFRQYLEEENINMIAQISHKMLSLIRQLEVFDIVELLAELEFNESSVSGKEHCLSLGKLAVERIEKLLQTMMIEENIQI